MTEHDPKKEPYIGTLDEDPKVSAAHRALRDAPPPALDARILAAASAAASEDQARAAARARWRRWAPAVGVAATLVLGLALSVQMLVMPGPARLEEHAKQAEMPRDMAQPVAREPAPAPAPTPAQPPLPVTLAPIARQAAPMVELPKADIAPRPAAAPLAVTAGGSAGYASPVEPPAPTAAERAAEADAARKEIAAEARAAFATPEPMDSWRKRIAVLRTAGKAEEAEYELSQFCVAYPEEAECEQP